MLAVGLHHKAVEKFISTHSLERSIRIACINSPDSTTVSGNLEAIDKLFSTLEEEKIFVRKLRTDDKAYHSHLMESVGQYYEDLLEPILSKQEFECLGKEDIRMFSSVTSQLAKRGFVSTSSYWRKNLESPVLFSDAMRELLSYGPFHMIEVGPHPALAQPIRDIQESLDASQSTYSSTLSRGGRDDFSMLKLAGFLFLKGHNLPFFRINNVASSSAYRAHYTNGSGPNGSSPEKIKMNGKVNGDHSVSNGSNGTTDGPDDTKAVTNLDSSFRVAHDLPTYVWNHQELLWSEPRISSEYRNLKYKRHDLLGSRIPGTTGKGYSWRTILKLQEVPWLQDHKLGQSIVFPAAAYLGMAIEGLNQTHEYAMKGKLTLKQVHLLNLLVLEAGGDGIEISMRLEPATISQTTSSRIWWRFEICSHISGVSTTHANGLISMQDASSLEGTLSTFNDCPMEEQATRSWYNKFAREGLCFGPEFRSLVEIKADRGRRLPYALAKTFFRHGGGSDAQQESDYLIHPVTIDAMLQAAIVGSAAGNVHDLKGKVPVVIGEFDLILGVTTETSEVCNIRAECEKSGFESVLFQAELQNASGHIIAQMKEVRAIAYQEPSLEAHTKLERNPFLRILWKPNISSLSNGDAQAFAKYLEQFSSLLPMQFQNTDVAYVAGAVDLITHKSGRMKILELQENADNILEELIHTTSIGGNHRHFESYTRCLIAPNSDLVSDLRALKREPLFDLVLIPSVSLTTSWLVQSDSVNLGTFQEHISRPI